MLRECVLEVLYEVRGRLGTNALKDGLDQARQRARIGGWVGWTRAASIFRIRVRPEKPTRRVRSYFPGHVEVYRVMLPRKLGNSKFRGVLNHGLTP
jgi:hypothetical protein